MRVDEAPSTDGTRDDREAVLLEERQITASPVPEAKVVSGNDDLCADPPEHTLSELLRLLLLQLVRELQHERLLHTRQLEEL